MKPVAFSLRVVQVLPHVVAVVVRARRRPAGALLLTHDEYVGLTAALEVGASQSGGLLTLRHDAQKWLVWRRRQKSGYLDTPRALKTPPRANCGPRRAIPAKRLTRKHHK